ncbi:MAG: hypothetical protein HUN05_11255 [Desulfobacter sp.]|nr:MAG: hypothetical protein HUN05_11255 [Desulfobacter sp.]
MNKKYFLPIFALFQILLMTVYAQEVSKPGLQELKEQADAVLNQSNVSARRDIDLVFKFADRLLELKEYDAAKKYLNKGLEHNPWDLDHQMVYASLLKEKGMKTACTEKANLVLTYAERDALIDKARQILDLPPSSDFQAIQHIGGTNHCIVLVPLQNCDNWLILKLQADISQILDIPVYIQTINAEYPAPSRDLRGQILNRIRRKIIKEENKDPQITFAMNQLNLNMADLNHDENYSSLDGPSASSKWETCC